MEVTAMKMGQVLAECYMEHMKHIQAKIYNSKVLPSGKCELIYPALMYISRGAKDTHYLKLHCLYQSHPSAVMVPNWVCFRGRTYLFSGIVSVLFSYGLECE